MDSRLEKIRKKKGRILDFLEFLQKKAKEENPNADIFVINKRRPSDDPFRNFNQLSEK